MFKQRNRKVAKTDNKATLDAKHKEITQEFKNNEERLEDFRNELDETNKKIKRYLKKKKVNLNDDELDDLFNLQEKKEEIETKIFRIENDEDAKDYFLKNGEILEKYYQDIENIAKGLTPSSKMNKKNDKPNPFSTKKRIVDFFAAFEEEDEIKEEESIKEENTVEKQEDVLKTEVVDRAKLLEDYLINIDPNFTVPCKLNKKVDFCYENGCNGIEMVLQYNEGIMECPNCGTIQQIIVDCDRPSYKDPPPEVAYFAYKRINHFNEWLAQFQGKESTDIPKEVFDKILLEIKKERITNMAKLTPDKIRGYLKKLGLNNHYDHIPFIINKLSGLPPPVISKETEEVFRAMFKELQSAFMVVCPAGRNNFLSYSYTLHKFAELRGLDHLKPCFPLLKSRQNLYNQDVLFKKCCELLGWQFIKSI